MTEAKKPKTTAADFDCLCGAVFDAAASVASATRGELDREAIALRVATTALCNAVLVRANSRLEDRRRKAIARSSDVLASRAA